MTYTRKLVKGAKVYTIVYDEYCILDTITDSDGKAIVSTSAIAKNIFRNRSVIFNGGIPEGFQKYKGV